MQQEPSLWRPVRRSVFTVKEAKQLRAARASKSAAIAEYWMHQNRSTFENVFHQKYYHTYLRFPTFTGSWSHFLRSRFPEKMRSEIFSIVIYNINRKCNINESKNFLVLDYWMYSINYDFLHNSSIGRERNLSQNSFSLCFSH